MQKVLIFCFLIFPGFCTGQELGLRYGAALADNKALTTPLGAGIFFMSDDSAIKICVLLSIDLYFTNRELQKDNVEAWAFRFKYSVGILGVLPLSQHLKLKIGLSVAYQKTNGFIDTYYTTYIDSYYIGAGIIFNLKFERLFNSGLNFDLFLSPEYLFHFDGYNRSDVRIAGFNMGISF